MTPKVLTCTSTECPRTVRIRSTGETPFTLTTIEIEGEFFEHDGACVGKTLASGQDCRLGVRYQPTSGDDPREATLVIHQTLRGDPTRVQLKGAGPSVTPTVDITAPTVESCNFTTGDSGRLQAALAVSLAPADGSEGPPQTVAVSAGIGAEELDVKEASTTGEAVNLLVPIPQERAVAGLVITVKADSRQEVAESEEDNNVTQLSAASVPTAGAACDA